ncbi:membrane protein insertase YidC [Corynebacterium breve]|uniref:Membrane protein insertase YidC n=1 Tax=Corynebacterium breve TaxID=3049799 RepID=A0ABY8VF07_9CORY|nr:membrane protein insertase YidC [Corynebacterium breve]WIM67687.1 membrane protein insertase YidC [Corynebacterium breve]
MLNFIYWPISAVLWFWHKIFGFVFGEGAGITWILAIMFLTFTIRILLVKPTVNQMRSGRKMQELQPQMQEIRAKYKNDQAKMAEETQKLYKEAKMNPLASCVAPLVQMPVFFGLFHVLRSFNRTGTGAGQLGLTVEQNRNTANYIFNPSEVQSFLDATIFGVPISAFISMPADMMDAYTTNFERWQVVAVAVPLILTIALFTHFNARLSLSRQKKRRDSGKTAAPTGDNAEMMEMQMNMMNKMMLWFLPGMILFTGFLWHIGLLFYMFANNIWTFVQNVIVFRKMDEEEAAEEAAKKEAKRTTAPQVGSRKVDKRTKKQRKQGQQGN